MPVVADPTLAEYVRQQARVRRLAARHGYRIAMDRTRDPRSVRFGRIYLVDIQTNGLAAEWFSLDDAEAALRSE